MMESLALNVLNDAVHSKNKILVKFRLFKVNKRNTRIMCEFCSIITVKLVFLLLTLNIILYTVLVLSFLTLNNKCRLR